MVVEDKELPNPETVIVAVVLVATKLYHRPYVVVKVAPPHAPAGAVLVAFLILSAVFVQDVPTVKVVGVLQPDCAWLSEGTINTIKNNAVVLIVACNMVFLGF